MARTTRSSVHKRKRLDDDPNNIDDHHARAILDVLQLIDNDGLLDRVFNTISLRTLLQQSASFHVLRSTVHSLFPIHSHPRDRPSKPAAQQLAFCNLALSLLDQAASQSLQLPLDVESLIDEPSSSPSTSYITPRYALVQHLPSGTYWSSLNSPFPTSDDPPRHLKDLPKGHAELVSVLPSPFPSSEDEPIPTLGSYHKVLPAQRSSKLSRPRYATRGSFLDYGIWASFAPSFDQEGVELGRNQLGELYFDRQQKKKQKQIAIDEFNEISTSDPAVTQHDQAMQQVLPSFDQDLLPSEQVAQLKNALDSLQLECAVTELLDRNRKALQRLQYLQYLRLMQDGGASSTVEQGSEEWDTAQTIMESLSLLASLRPRSSKDDQSPLIPSPAALHLLHRTLPLSPTAGWHGNLPPGRSTALRDDSTIKVRPGTTIPTPTANATSTPAPTATSYSGYQYNYSAIPQAQPSSHYRTTTPSTTTTPYLQYKPTQTSYYQSAYAPQTSTSQSPYYGTHSAVQQPYGLAGWYNAYNPSSSATAPTTTGTADGTGSGSAGRGTPQPGVVTPAPSYSSFFSSALTSSLIGQRTPAVGNTVVKSGAPGTPTPQAPTLPTHLQLKQPTPQAQNGTSVTSYYQNWQQQQTGTGPGVAGTGTSTPTMTSTPTLTPSGTPAPR